MSAVRGESRTRQSRGGLFLSHAIIITGFDVGDSRENRTEKVVETEPLR